MGVPVDFNVATDNFRGPIDLLLFLVRRHEVELEQVPLSSVTEQYIEYLEVLKEIQIDTVGDFIEVASLLIEMKARAALPRNEFEPEESVEDPRQDLVQRLLMYKQFKDAAILLEEKASHWQTRYGRVVDDLPPRKVNLAEQPIQEVELWDLVSAFGRVLRDNVPKPEANIVYDETPIQVYMKQIHSQLATQGSISFLTLFGEGMHKSAMIGVFLAVLELARHHNVATEQPDLHGDINIVPCDGFNPDLELADVDDYDPHKPKGDPASLVG